MKYKILKTIAGPGINAQRGTVHEIPEDLVESFTKAGAIEEIDGPTHGEPLGVFKEKIETAEAPKVEKKEIAVVKKRRSRKTLVSG